MTLLEIQPVGFHPDSQCLDFIREAKPTSTENNNEIIVSLGLVVRIILSLAFFSLQCLLGSVVCSELDCIEKDSHCKHERHTNEEEF